MTEHPPAPAAGTGQWLADGEQWTLRLAGDWRGAADSRLAPAPPEIRSGCVVVDGRALQAWDTSLPALLWERLAPLRQRRVALDITALPAALHEVLELALRIEPAAAGPPSPPARPGGVDRIVALGVRSQRLYAEALVTAGFVGEVLLAFGRLLRGRSDMRWSDLVHQIDRCGPQSLPIVSLTCGLFGLMLAYMGGAQLDRVGAQSLIANVVAVGMVREMAALMVGVILAGRLGASFAAQLGSMQADEEIDALRAMGIDPISHLVLPRLIALMLVAPLLWAYAALVGVLAGLPAVVWGFGLPAPEYIQRCLAVVLGKHVWIGLFKCGLYVVLLALAGCREGFHAGRSTEAVGDATTRAVVKGLVWIVAAASLTTMVLQSLKL
jgi:phospholipid/cholesterol/gamma-HCH transport system permease protein